MIAAYILSAWLAADLATGIVHWWEDRYGNPAWPILGPHVVAPNIRHHSEPRAFLQGGYWTRNWTTVLPTAAIAGAALALGHHWLALAAAFATQANEIHGWAHQRCSRPIRGLQLLGVLSSPDGHAAHHSSPFATDFCVMSDWLNPTLSMLGFWRGLKAVVGLAGIHPRPERQTA
jgi:ubiquitin-conjugating enzyme E2 variant